MATTTPNYGWDVPTSSDYVKDGAVAIETLGDDIDASLFGITGGANVGMVHLNTTTLTSVASVQINNVFTSAYTNYLVDVNITNTTLGGDFNVKLSNGGTPVSSSYSTAGGIFGVSGGSGSLSSLGTGRQAIANGVAATAPTLGKGGFQLRFFQPNLAEITTMTCDGVVVSGSGIDTYVSRMTHYVATAYDGFQLIYTGTNMTGNVRIYGLRNS
jgi:hypothetical protein